MPLRGVLVLLESAVQRALRFVCARAPSGSGLPVCRLPLSEPVPFEPHRTHSCFGSSPELRSALTGRSSGQPSSRLRLLTAAAHLYVRCHYLPQ